MFDPRNARGDVFGLGEQRGCLPLSPAALFVPPGGDMSPAVLNSTRLLEVAGALFIWVMLVGNVAIVSCAAVLEFAPGCKLSASLRGLNRVVRSVGRRMGLG
jgi:hypothetical protein